MQINKQDELINHLFRIAEVSEQLLKSAQQKNWQEFFDLLKKREKLLKKYDARLSDMEKQKSKLASETRARIRGELQTLFDKIAKVDQKIFDIINSEKERFFDEIIKMNKGLAFLKEYERKILSKSSISKLY